MTTPNLLNNWTGVTADSDDNVTRLNLTKVGLSGPIPAVVGDLRSLKELRLSNNDLDGAIPPELGYLRNLKALYLDNNDLSGPYSVCVGGTCAASARYYLDNNLVERADSARVGELTQPRSSGA